MGLENFAKLSNGEDIHNPRFFRRDEKELAKAQRKLSQAEKGTPERAKRRTQYSISISALLIGARTLLTRKAVNWWTALLYGF